MRAVFSEGIDCVGERWLSDVRLEALPVDHIHRSTEQTGDVVLQVDIIEDTQLCSRIEIYQDVDIAFAALFATRKRAEQRSVCDAMPVKIVLVPPERRDDAVSVHKLRIILLQQ